MKKNKYSLFRIVDELGEEYNFKLKAVILNSLIGQYDHNFTKKILRIFSDDEDYEIRCFLISIIGSVPLNASTVEEFLEKLVFDEEVEVRERIAGSSDVSEEIYVKLADDESLKVVKVLSENRFITPHTIKMIYYNVFYKKDKEEYLSILRNLSRHPKTPFEILKELLKIEDDIIQLYLTKRD